LSPTIRLLKSLFFAHRSIHSKPNYLFPFLHRVPRNPEYFITNPTIKSQNQRSSFRRNIITVLSHLATRRAPVGRTAIDVEKFGSNKSFCLRSTKTQRKPSLLKNQRQRNP
ncbi:unnamed protein product, partial [Linum tenue]